MDAVPYGTAVTHRDHRDWKGKVVGRKGDKITVHWTHRRRLSSLPSESLIAASAPPRPDPDLFSLRSLLKEALAKALEWESRGHPWQSAPLIVKWLNEVGWA